MRKIQNKRLVNTDINFENVGIVKSNEEGIFEIEDDAVAVLVVNAIKGFEFVSEPFVETPVVKETKSKIVKAKAETIEAPKESEETGKDSIPSEEIKKEGE